jgi:hypothetical protein
MRWKLAVCKFFYGEVGNVRRMEKKKFLEGRLLFYALWLSKRVAPFEAMS